MTEVETVWTTARTLPGRARVRAQPKKQCRPKEIWSQP